MMTKIWGARGSCSQRAATQREGKETERKSEGVVRRARREIEVAAEERLKTILIEKKHDTT
jgi:hypothetical protein